MVNILRVACTGLLFAGLVIVVSCEESTEKRCPNDCKKPKVERLCSRCNGCEGCMNLPSDESPLMKRFISGLEDEELQLIQHAPAKRNFIEHLLKRSKPGPNVGDVDDSAVGKIGVRNIPSEESRNMRNFKKSLNEEDAKILLKHRSKVGYIQALLDSKSAVDKRDQIATNNVETKRNTGQEHKDTDAGVKKVSSQKKDILLQKIHSLVEGLKRSLDDYSTLTKSSDKGEERR